jgi:uncharacterized protein
MSIWFLLLALLAEVLGTVGGFGSSVLFVPIANFFFPLQAALGLTALFHLASNVSKIFLFRQGLNRALLLRIGLPAVVGVMVGGLLVGLLPSLWIEWCLALFLIITSLFFLLRPTVEVPPTDTNAILGGSLSGFTAGLLGTGGAIRGITMAAFNLEKSVFIATSAAIDLGVDATRSVVYFQRGFMRWEDAHYLPWLVAIGFAGSWIGMQLLRFVPQSLFKTIALLLVLLIGLATLYKVLFFY